MNEAIKSTHAEIGQFYDEFSQRLVSDFVYGNPRVESAISFVNRYITTETDSVLDVGCGIGASSCAYLQQNSGIRVVGTDISPRNIELARRLFGEDHDDLLEFRVSDLSRWPDGDRFDLIAMLDIYEHVPRESRASFQQSLATALQPEGRLVMTIPSLFHQEYLREQNSDGLQIVDEDVSLPDVFDLADSIAGTITHYEHVSIWFTNDYVHVAIEREPRHIPKSQVTRRPTSGSGSSSSRLKRFYERWFGQAEDDFTARRRLVEQKLNISLPAQRS